MPTITATADNAKSQVRLDLDFSDIDAPCALVTRVDAATGATTVVRGHGASTTINGVAYVPMQAGYKAVLYDTEMPLDKSFYYTATAPSVTMNATSTFAGGYVDPWFPSASTTSLRITASLNGTFFLTFSGDGTTANPSISGEEIPATAGATFTLTVLASATVSSSLGVGLRYRDSSGNVLSNPGTTVTVFAATTITTTSTAPANTVSVQAFMTVIGTPAATTSINFSTVTVTNTAGSATSGAATVQSLGACRLKDPLRPGSNVRVDFAFDPNPQCTPTEGVFFQSLDVEQRAANAATFNVNNQTKPVVVSKTRSSVTSTLTLVSRTFADRDRLNAILETGSPLLFQVPAEYGVPDRTLAVGQTSVSRILPDHRFPIRVFSLPFASVTSPGGPMQGTSGARWSDLCNRYASWSAVNAAGLTWVQLLDGSAG